MEIPKLADLLKLSPPILFGVALATGTLLFAPEAAIARLGLEQVILAYRGILGAAFVLTSALLVSHIAAKAVSALRTHIGRSRGRNALRAKMKTLTPVEQSILAGYISKDTPTQYFHITDGVVNGLVAKKILFQSSNLSVRHTLFAFNIQPWVREYLLKHPDLLSGVVPMLTEIESAAEDDW